MPQLSGDNPAPSERPGYLAGATGEVLEDLFLIGKPGLTRASLVPGNQPRGSVLGLVTASGLYALSDPTASDGRQTPTAVLVRVANLATGQSAMIATGGQFNSRYLFWSQNWTLAALSAALNANGITAQTRGLA